MSARGPSPQEAQRPSVRFGAARLAILARDPIDEEAARGLMRCCEKLGDANGVRKVDKVLRESLRRELEDEHVELFPEMTALIQELM